MEIIEQENNTYYVKVENSLDIVFIYHILMKKGSNVILKINWQDKLHEKGKYRRLSRIYTYAKIKPVKIYLDSRLNSIRITGTVLDSEYEEIIGKKLGGDIRIGDNIKIETIEKLEIFREKRNEETSLGIVILDLTGYLVSEINSRVKILAEKYYPFEESTKDDFIKEVEILNGLINKMKEKEAYIIAGVNIGTKSIAKKLRNIDLLIYGDFSPDISGIINLLKNEKIKTLKNSFYNTIMLYEEIINRDRFNKVLYGIDEVLEKAEYGMIYRVLVTRNTLLEHIEIVEKLYKLFLSCIEIDLIDDENSLGIYLNSLGGIAGFRY